MATKVMIGSVLALAGMYRWIRAGQKFRESDGICFHKQKCTDARCLLDSTIEAAKMRWQARAFMCGLLVYVAMLVLGMAMNAPSHHH